MFRQLLNTMRQQADMAGGTRAMVRHGIVSGYDPGSYCAKVQLMPEGHETGWLPVVSPWVGNGWGLFAPPSIGDAVEVQFQEDDIEAGFVCQRFFNDADRPLGVQSGEFWLVHQSGSFLKFHNNGNVDLHAAADLSASVAGNANVAVTGNMTSSAAQWNHSGPVQIDGTALITGLITGQGGMAVSGGSGATVAGDLAVTGGNVTADGISLKTHTHNGVQPGGGNTGQPQ